MSFSTKLGAIAIKLETNEGTEEQPLAADALLAQEPKWKINGEFVKPDMVTEYLSPEPGISGKRSATLTFKTLFKASGTPGTAPEIDNLLKAAAFKETINTGRSAIYDAASTPNSSYTVALYINISSSAGKRYTFRGCRVSWSFTGELGQLLYINWEVTAADWTEYDVTPISGMTYQTALPVMFMGASIIKNGAEIACINSLTIDSGNKISLRECVASVMTPVTFTGSGLDDMTKSGIFVGDYRTSFRYRIQIDATGAPDTFKWSNDGGETWEATGVSITGSAQLLENGVSVTFATTTGHTLDERWDFSISNGGHYSAVITDTEPTGFMNPEEVLIADEDVYGRFRNGTEMTLAIFLVTSAGNNITIYIQSMQYKELTPSDRNNIRTLDQNLVFNRNNKTGSITAFADASGGKVTVTSAAHGLGSGAHVTITGTTNYNGDFMITNVTTNTYDIVDTWVSDDGTGSWDAGDSWLNITMN